VSVIFKVSWKGKWLMGMFREVWSISNPATLSGLSPSLSFEATNNSLSSGYNSLHKDS